VYTYIYINVYIYRYCACRRRRRRREPFYSSSTSVPIAKLRSATPPLYRPIPPSVVFLTFLFFYRSFYLLFSAGRQNLVTDNNLTLTDAVQRTHTCIYIYIYIRYYDAIQHILTHPHAHTCALLYICICAYPTFDCVYFGVTSRLCCTAADFIPTFIFYYYFVFSISYKRV
jgi:hypothetical protein